MTAFPRTWRWLLLAHFALTALMALGNPHLHLLDDAYYTLTIARNIAGGAGITYGGLPTNGFQPLYGFAMAPVMAVFGDAPETALKFAKLLLALCSTGLLYVLMRLARELVDNRAALMTGALYVANANLFAHHLSGLETALHGWLFWLFVLWYLRHRDTGSPWRLAGLGVLLGLVAYARFDSVFLFIAVAADLAWRHRAKPAELIRRGALLFGPATLLLAPWFVWSKIACGSFGQSSGSFHRWRGLLQQDVPESTFGFAKFAVAKLVSLAVKLPLEPLLGYERGMRLAAGTLLGKERMQSGFLLQLLREKPTVAIALGALGLAAAALLVWVGRRRLPRLKKLQPLAFLLLALGGASLFYPLYLLNYSMRHFFVFSAGLAIVWGALLSGETDGKPARRAISLVLLAAALALPGLRLWATDHTPRAAWKLVDTIEANVPAGAKIGYTDCGVFGYYLTDHTVVNLDGILNFDALHAMKNGDIGAYLFAHEVPYVLHLHNFQADYADQWRQFIAPRATPLAALPWIWVMDGLGDSVP
jgi:Dolichyl-phosphate-mannose-protein mannosyltransferase